MSMNANEDVVRSSPTFRATVDLPDPEPPAIPMIKGLSIASKRYDVRYWNALCPSLMQLESLRYEADCHENSIDCIRFCACRRARLQRVQTRIRHHRR